MKKVIYLTFIILIGFTFAANAQMKLSLATDISGEHPATLDNHNPESNF